MTAGIVTTTPAEAPTAADTQAGPVVALPRQGLSDVAIAGIAVAAAAALLVTLNARRSATDPSLLAATTTATFASPPPLALSPDPATATGPDAGPRRATQGPSAEFDPMGTRPRYGYRTMAPTGASGSYPGMYPGGASPMSRGSTGMMTAGAMPPPYVPGQPFGASAAPSIGSGPGDANSALVIDIGRDPSGRPDGGIAGGTAPGTAANRPIRATLIANRASLVVEGTVVNATLETPIDSTRPGLIRAIVGEDVRGFDGRRVLIPRGSRLTGEYRADVQSGQRRVLATWTRLIRPDGVAVRIDSPAADRLGGTGIPGQVHSNFLQRFASAVLQSALNVGVNLASRSNGSTVIIGPVGGNMTQILPTPESRRSIKVASGQPVSVFVARDLDFSDVPGWR